MNYPQSALLFTPSSTKHSDVPGDTQRISRSRCVTRNVILWGEKVLPSLSRRLEVGGRWRSSFGGDPRRPSARALRLVGAFASGAGDAYVRIAAYLMGITATPF